MHLPFLKKKTITPQKREYFLALEISETSLSCACWSVINNKPQVLGLSKSVRWDGQHEDSLTSATDSAISASTTPLDPSGNIDPEKVVLGVPPHWIQSEKIHPDKAKLLKHMTQKLSLLPLGFVVTPEAVVRYLQIADGVPPTGILLGVTDTDIALTLVRLGKIDGMETVIRSDSVAADVAEGLSRLNKQDVLPSRMLLYGTNDSLESIKQQLLAFPWQSPHSHIKFLHLPKVEVLPSNFSLHALAIASGSEMVSQFVSMSTPAAQPASPIPDASPASVSDTNFEDAVPLVPVPELSDIPADMETTPEVLPDTDYSQPSPQALGFVIEEAQPVESAETVTSSRPARRLPSLSLPKLALPRVGGLVAIGAVVLVLGAILTAAYWYLPKAEVVVSVQPKQIQQGFDVTSSTSATTADVGNNTIPASLLETTISDQKSAPATGSKIIGDKATGKVTIISGLEQSKVVPAGTVLVSPSGLKFTLDADVKVASASGSPLDKNEFKPGQVTAAVTAGQIGVDSNLTAGTQFKVGSFGSSVIIAKNEEAFSGGSSRQAKVVSKDDIAKLRADLTATLKDQAKSQLSEKIASGQVLLPQTVEVKTVSEDVDHKADSAADSVTLKLTVRSTGLAYNQSDIASLTSSAILKDLPEKYSPSGNPEPVIALKSYEKTGAVLGVQIDATALPQIDTDALSAALIGKSTSSAIEYIKSLPGVGDVEINFSPSLPSFLRRLPHIQKNISVTLKS